MVAACTAHVMFCDHERSSQQSLSLTRGMLDVVTSCSELIAACLLGYFPTDFKNTHSYGRFPQCGRWRDFVPRRPPNTAFAFQPVTSLARHAQVRATKIVSSAKWAGLAWRMPVWVRSILWWGGGIPYRGDSQWGLIPV